MFAKDRATPLLEGLLESHHPGPSKANLSRINLRKENGSTLETSQVLFQSCQQAPPQ
jgi:hypothetical protein